MKHEDIQFIPLEGFCLCEYPGAQQTEGGVYVPETAAESHENEAMKLRVVAVGPGEQLDAGRRREVMVEPGGTYYFLFPSYSIGAPIKLNGKKYVIVQSRYVCGRAL